MHGPRFVVASAGAQWRIVRGGPRRLELYASKTQAVCAAIEFAEHEAGAEVVVQHEDGYFITEWVQGQDAGAEKAARPEPIAAGQANDLAAEEPDESGPQGGYGGTGDDEDQPKR
jgi:Uncharacterized protein conserved in bacteria (DUF2188)